MGFVAAQAVVALDYDFTGLGVPELDGVKGTSPEPSQDQHRDMKMAIRELYGMDLDAGSEEMTARVKASLSPEGRREQDLELAKIYADVCSQQPTTEQILALPARVLTAYIGYLSGELLTPTAGSPATSNSRAPLKSV